MSGSGKSSTLAGMVSHINNTWPCHIITIEDPIEFLHNHKCATVHQRELHSDTPSFAHALRAALRQAPKVIMVGDIRDRETMETVLDAAETGHLVLSSLHTADASKTVERLVGVFSPAEQPMVRGRLARCLRFVICQRLLPRGDGSGRVPVVEIFKSTSHTRECLENGEFEGHTLLDAIRTGEADGMQHFDGEIAKLVRAGVVDTETALSYATNPAHLQSELDVH
jgi:twitching motility protein PilT